MPCPRCRARGDDGGKKIETLGLWRNLYECLSCGWRWAVAQCRHTAGATYGADRGACAVCIAASYATVREEATRVERERAVAARSEGW